MNAQITFSFLLPTRNRVQDLKALMASIQRTTRHLDQLEIVLGVDEDDVATRALTWPDLNITQTLLPRGLTMGAMNNACYRASRGRYVMLMNDDMILHTEGWDEILTQALAPLRDDIVLVHVNDLLFSERLCCFPMLSRTFCELAGGVCPETYERYRIDDHIYNVFNLLALAGHRRILYFPDVVFEHLNFEANGTSGREYQYHKPTLERDAQRYEASFEDRKRFALALADHIEAFQSRAIREARGQVLAALATPEACRRPDHPRRVGTAGRGGDGRGERVTLGLVCGDIRNSHTQTCISLLKAHTSNCELVVLDNGHDPDFNHAREMNRLLAFSRNRQVVLLDDDVFVAPGWLEDMQAALTGRVGCVTPVHLDGAGRRSYAGVYVGLEDQGDHGHLLEAGPEPQPTPTLCSAVMLIDMERCGHLRFDEGYLKYFHDLDYGLQVWECGSAVAVSTGVPVVHLGGATLKQGSAAAMTFHDRDRRIFLDRWMAQGRLARLRTEVWSSVPDLDRLYRLPEAFAALLDPAALARPGWRDQVLACASVLESAPALRASFLTQIKRFLFQPEARDTPEAREHLRWARSLVMVGRAETDELATLRIRVAAWVDQWQTGHKRVVVYPAGAQTAALFKDTDLMRANVVGLGDANPLLEGEEKWGKLIVAPQHLATLAPDVVLVASKPYQEEICRMLTPLLPATVELVRLFPES